jgi:hypothetical protein
LTFCFSAGLLPEDKSQRSEVLDLLALFSIRLLDSDDSAESQLIEGAPTSDSEQRTVTFGNVESLPVVKNDEQLSPSGDQNGGSDDGGVLEPEAGGEEFSGQHVQVIHMVPGSWIRCVLLLQRSRWLYPVV